jgi:hypothetical protein
VRRLHDRWVTARRLTTIELGVLRESVHDGAMHLRLTIVAAFFAAWLPAARAYAEAAVGWTFTPPAGWAVSRAPDHVAYTKFAGPSFCQLVLYKTRAMAAAADAELEVEWKRVVDPSYTASDPKSLGEGRTRAGVPYGALSATLTDRDHHAYAGHLYILIPPPLVGSLLVVSSTSVSLNSCQPSVQALLASLTVDLAARATPAPAAAPPTVATSSVVVGSWATSVAGQPNDGSPTIVRQYVLDGDGTYRYHSEIWGGAYRSDDYTILDERGTYVISGNQLTINPTSSTGVTRGKAAIRKTFQVALEKVTYTWTTHYFAGIKETDLVLTPSAKTKRDGELASNSQFPGSYLLSGNYKPSWTFPP